MESPTTPPSPLWLKIYSKPGMLYAGTDDGLLQVSWDDGQTWNDVTSQLAGLPKETWINTIEPSSHQAGRAYVAINNYRNDDFNNYIYQTDDYGKTWKSIEGNLPENRVARTLREDPKKTRIYFIWEQSLDYSSVSIRERIG